MNFIENETPQKLRGGYYTDGDIAAYLCRWVGEIAPARILEPSCGDGAFLRALAACRPPGLAEVVGCELLAAEAAKARTAARALPKQVRTELHEEDFLGLALRLLDTGERFDAVVGNPPFIRYQYLDAALQGRAQALFARFGLPFTKHTNAWVSFVIASLALLRPGGRLAMVVPAELLHVLHATSLRSYLLNHCARVLVLDPEELWFQGTLQGVVLLLLERGRDEIPTASGAVAVLAVRGRSFLAEAAAQAFSRASFVSGAALGSKWMTALLSDGERRLLLDLRQHPAVRPFVAIAHAAVGIVTGANKFFLVTDEVVARFDLSSFAHPMFGRSEHVPGVLYDERTHRDNKDRGLPTNFLWFADTDEAGLPAGARRYLEQGEAEGLHRRYKCRIRSPWYCVPSVFTAPVGMLKRSHDHPRLLLNSASAFCTDTAYRISPRAGLSAEQLVFGYVNSLTALSAELEGRHYGGGVLELVPSEINRVLVPFLPDLVPDVPALDRLFRAATPSVDILAAQDERVLCQMGLCRADRERLLGAWLRLRSRRHRRGDGEEPPGSEGARTT